MEEKKVEEVVTQSPLPIIKEKEKKEIKGKTFPEIMEAVKGGFKIHKLEWENKEFYGVIKDEMLVLHKPDGKFHQWTISEADINGDDWVVLG